MLSATIPHYFKHIKSKINHFHLYIHKRNVVYLGEKKEKTDEDGGIKAFLLGLGLGTIGYAILSFLTKPRCPNCHNEIDKYTPRCPNCKMYLQWR